MARNEQHKCSANNCKSEKLGGMKLKCSNCDETYYLDCKFKEDGIYELVMEIGLVKNSGEKLEAQVTEGKTKKFYELFSESSLIEFACKECKSKNDTKNEKIQRMGKEERLLKQKNKKLNEQLNDEKTVISKLLKQNDDMMKDMEEKNKIIERMADDSEHPSEWEDTTNLDMKKIKRFKKKR